jgi:hypothetical protein
VRTQHNRDAIGVRDCKVYPAIMIKVLQQDPRRSASRFEIAEVIEIVLCFGRKGKAYRKSHENGQSEPYLPGLKNLHNTPPEVAARVVSAVWGYHNNKHAMTMRIVH